MLVHSLLWLLIVCEKILNPHLYLLFGCTVLHIITDHEEHIKTEIVNNGIERCLLQIDRFKL